jgi:cyanate lyase
LVFLIITIPSPYWTCFKNPMMMNPPAIKQFTGQEQSTAPPIKEIIIMLQSDLTQDARTALTARVITSKALKDLTWAAIAEGTGLHVAYVTAALLGQHALPAAAASMVAERLDLGAADAKQLQSVPMRGSIPGGVPTDPTIYRFYEMVQVYGTTLKALVHEQFGDGIISAINFRLDIRKEADPDGGERAVITLDGKFLPYKPF